jgi:hypothetical protein
MCSPTLFHEGLVLVGERDASSVPQQLSAPSHMQDMILETVLHLSCVQPVLHMDSRSGPWLYLLLRLAFDIFQLLLQIKQLELKRGELLLAGSVGLFDGEQSLHQVGLRLEQVA